MEAIGDFNGLSCQLGASFCFFQYVFRCFKAPWTLDSGLRKLRREDYDDVAEADAEAIDQAPPTPDSTTAPDTALESKKEQEVDSESEEASFSTAFPMASTSNAWFSLFKYVKYRMTSLG